MERADRFAYLTLDRLHLPRCFSYRRLQSNRGSEHNFVTPIVSLHENLPSIIHGSEEMKISRKLDYEINELRPRNIFIIRYKVESETLKNCYDIRCEICTKIYLSRSK